MELATLITKITEQEYLAEELYSEVKHELIDGQIYAMAGAHKNHVRLVSNLITKFQSHLTTSPCETFATDMKVRIDNKNFFYPDVIVACDEDNDDNYYSQFPILIVEVLSPSTRRLDKGRKRLAYQTLSSLQEYVLIAQDVVEIEICRRAAHWQSEYYFLGDEVYFASIDLRLSVIDLYARVKNEELINYAKNSR